MKFLVTHFLLGLLLAASVASCSSDAAPSATRDTDNLMGNTLYISIGNKRFTATLYDNPSAAAFKALLPLTVEMKELNGNEKFVDLPQSLPANASKPGTIQKGDLLLYGASTVVLFYKSFPTTYTYSKLARIDDASDLAAAVGTGNVSVTFEIE